MVGPLIVSLCVPPPISIMSAVKHAWGMVYISETVNLRISVLFDKFVVCYLNFIYYTSCLDSLRYVYNLCICFDKIQYYVGNNLYGVQSF